MKTILVTAYAMNPYKGSEEGMGWQFTLQIARYHRVIAVTRVNNGPAIRRYIEADGANAALYERISFIYFDWPFWLRFWKKGPLLSMIYYYGWQLTLALWLRTRRTEADVVHNLNFHNDWTPSFLWILGRPMVWGPVGHHPAIPREYLAPIYGRGAWLRDRLLWRMKQLFWSADPFLRLTERKADVILCMNSAALRHRVSLRDKCRLLPSVAAERPLCAASREAVTGRPFRVLSAGRMVPLKGFDMTVRAFSLFYHDLPESKRRHAELVLAGSGDCEQYIRALIEKEGIAHCTRMVRWMPRDEMQELYRGAAVFLFPSHEGAGMVVAEAMSYGLPVICLDNEGPGEFIHPASSLKAPCSSYESTIHELARRLLYLAITPAYYQEESLKSRERFCESFDWELRGEQLKKIYTSICPDNVS